MALSRGERLGHYEILAPIGAGGMGEVYRARDTQLKRDVAIKILPPAFADDPERLARFKREAEVLASLNHPNIATIHGTAESALVMEFVEGESPQGPLPFEQAWHIAAQIAAALDYAHEKGVVHRDHNPANDKDTTDGVVKLLDFGLAKAFAGPAGTVSSDPANSPTLTFGATQVGVILGTVAYMAPEQAKGKVVDKRADIWAFGVVLYELLTGERLFQGEDVSETLAHVNVVSFPTPGGVRQVSTGGGSQPRWQRDGKELFYVSLDRKMMSVRVSTGATFQAETPLALFDTQLPVAPLRQSYAVSPDGRRFLVPTPLELDSTPLTLIQNWAVGFKR